MTVIAMTREMGTLGKDVARLLSERLDLQIIHHELVEEPFERGHSEHPSEVHRHLNGGPAKVNASVAGLAAGGYMTPLQILELASRGNVILRGWGAARLLRAIPHVLCVRICAPMGKRVEEMKRRLAITEATARREIRHNDAQHSTVFSRFFERDWRDPLNYDLVLNTGQLAPETCTDILMDAISSPAFQKTNAAQKELNERWTAARIASLLRSTNAFRRRAGSVHVSLSDGAVKLYGTARDRGTAREIEDAVRAEIGDEVTIRNEIQVTGPYDNA